MKISHKAALLSAFVFPGLGQLYLKRYWRGLAFLSFVLTELGYVIWATTVSALDRLDEAMVQLQSGTANLQEFSDIAGSNLFAADPHHTAVIYIIVCLWIFAVIDAYRIGKQRDIREDAYKSDQVPV